MPSPTAYWKSLQGWAGRHWPLLGALGTALAFAVMAGGVALAAYSADFAGPAMSLALGAVAIWLVKQYARGVIKPTALAIPASAANRALTNF